MMSIIAIKIYFRQKFTTLARYYDITDQEDNDNVFTYEVFYVIFSLYEIQVPPANSFL